MNILEKINISQKVFKALLLKKKIPLYITWNITYRCNLKCRYCGWPENATLELDTERIKYLIGKAVSSGTKFIHFSGGEPLLREDLSEIIDFCKQNETYLLISSNGMLVKEKINQISKIDEIKLSLDGPKHINDYVRGQGTYERVVEAIDICKKKGMKVEINTVISKYNTESIHHLTELAEQFNIKVQFQPATQTHSGDSDRDITKELPNIRNFKKAVDFLINEKLKGNQYISNSISGLRFFYNWPHTSKLSCLMSLISCVISPEGKIFICDNFPDYHKYLVPINKNFRETFNNLKFPYFCPGCWNSSMLEFNLISKLKTDILSAVFKKVTRRL